MKLSELKILGGVVGKEPQIVPVEWNGNEFDVGILPLSYGKIESFQKQTDREFNTLLISETVVLEDGERMSYEDAFRLDPALAAVLLVAINAEHQKKALSKTSGMNSSLPASGAAPSPKQKRTSVTKKQEPGSISIGNVVA